MTLVFIVSYCSWAENSPKDTCQASWPKRGQGTPAQKAQVSHSRPQCSSAQAQVPLSPESKLLRHSGLSSGVSSSLPTEHDM